jgi:nitrite reductase/ring-hydroxylating ferredoxin subunit
VTDKDWQEVMDASAVVEEEPVRAYVGENETEIALFNVGGEIFATGNICTHAMASMHDGIQEGEVIECPLHDGKFNIKTGEALCPPVTDPLPTYEVKVENGKVFVKV